MKKKIHRLSNAEAFLYFANVLAKGKAMKDVSSEWTYNTAEWRQYMPLKKTEKETTVALFLKYGRIVEETWRFSKKDFEALEFAFRAGETVEFSHLANKNFVIVDYLVFAVDVGVMYHVGLREVEIVPAEHRTLLSPELVVST